MKIAVLLLTILALTIPQQSFAVGNDQGGSRKDAMMEKKQELKETMKQDHADMKADLQQRKSDFKEKLKTLKDEKKKAIAEQLDTRLVTINKNRTDRMTENLKKLNAILDQLKLKRDAEKTAGHDITAVNTAITAAEQALTAAQAAVVAQAGMDYTAQVTDDSTLKQNFGQVVSKLTADLQKTHKTVTDAKEAVRAVVKALRQVKGDEITGEVQPSPTTAQ
jgi:hypothetical protein